MITSRRELAGLLASPEVRAVMAMGPGASPEYLADAILAADGNGEVPVGELWDRVESTLARRGVRPIGHVGRMPLVELGGWLAVLGHPEEDG